MSKMNSRMKSLSEEAEKFSMDELREFLRDSKEDTNDFIRGQALQLEKYVRDLELDKITLKQFQSNVQDLLDLGKIYVSKEKVRGKVKIRNFIGELIRIVIHGLIKSLL